MYMSSVIWTHQETSTNAYLSTSLLTDVLQKEDFQSIYTP